MPPTLTGHGQGDGLARLVVPVLVIDRLHVVTPGVRGHRGQDDQGVLQRDGSAAGERGGSEAKGDIEPGPSFPTQPAPGWGDQAPHPSLQAEPMGLRRFLGFLFYFFFHFLFNGTI